MGFKLPGKSMTSGTSGHSSALKMKAASALKAKNPKAKTYDEAYDAMETVHTTGKVTEEYPEGVPTSYKWDQRPKLGGRTHSSGKKGRARFIKEAEDWNMKTYGTKNPTSAANKANMTKKELAAQYKVSQTTPEVKTDANDTNDTNDTNEANNGNSKPSKTKSKTKTEKKIAEVEKKHDDKQQKLWEEVNTSTSKKREKNYSRNWYEVLENREKKVAKIKKKDARKTYGKDSKEFLEAKKAHLKAKEIDRQGLGTDDWGGEKGKKQGLFRKLSSKINKKRQEKNQAKIDALDNQQ